MKYLIDAYNVLHCAHILPEPWGYMPQVDGLAAFIAQSRLRSVVLICDGTMPTELTEETCDSFPGVRIIFAGGGQDADTRIEQILQRTSHARDMVVVSNDRRVQAAGRRRKATVVRSEDFLRQVLNQTPEKSDRKAPAQTEAEIEHWLATFTTDEPDASNRPAAADERDAPDTTETPQPPTAKPDTEDADSVEAWMKRFGFE